jgi:hypothetical protein
MPLPIPIKKPSIVQNLRSVGSTLNVNVRPLLVPDKRQLLPQDKSGTFDNTSGMMMIPSRSNGTRCLGFARLRYRRRPTQ